MTTQTTGGEAVGVTISSFCSVSLEPPLVLFCLGKKTSNLEAYTESNFFAVNILAADQVDISEKFASQSDNKFEGIVLEHGRNGCPIIAECVANLECKLIETYEGGDHIILLGEVDYLRTTQVGAPLLRYRGNYVSIG